MLGLLQANGFLQGLAMRITLYLTDGTLEKRLRTALIKGFERHGEQVAYVPKHKFTPERARKTDLVVFVGVKGRQIFNDCKQVGVPTLMIDKGYFHRDRYLRFSLGDYQPPYFHALNHDSSRLERQLGIKLKPRVQNGKLVLFAGSSDKYCLFHGLGSAHVYAHTVCTRLNELAGSSKTVVYRPKPSWWARHVLGDAKNWIPRNVKFSGPDNTLAGLLPNTHCLVTHGSNSAIEALVHGVPVVLLSDEGISPVRPLCETKLENVLDPYWPSDEERLKIFSNLAHCQFSIDEIAGGIMWTELKQWYGYKQ